MLSSKLGLCIVDVDNPQLNMHFIRETGNMDDVRHDTDLLRVSF
jgi:aspartyl aminopeptidase